MREVVFFDLETGGLDERQHPVIQIAAIAADWQSLDVLAEFERKIVFDPAQCEPEALDLNSYEAGTWSESAVEREDALLDFAAFLRQHATVPQVSRRGSRYHVAQMAAYNAEFDMRWIKHEFQDTGMFFPGGFQALCTLQRIRWHFVERGGAWPASFRLTDVCEFLGIDVAGAHDAQADNRMQLELVRWLRKEVARV